MSNVAGIALFTAALFLLVVAVMLNSPALFYMSTAMVATILAARWQAWSAIRDLSFERRVPASARVGEWVHVEILAKSDRKTRRPLIRIYDHLPPSLVNSTITSSTPIAPANGEPVISRYKFIPERRGVYKWSKLSVIGHDALGIVTMLKEYPANGVELAVLPTPISVPFDFEHSAGWGSSEAEHGLSRGVGIEPRGIREYSPGDSMRYVHWRSSARTNKLVVKEFETGSNAIASFFVQNSAGSEVGVAPRTTTELICAHLAYVVGRGLRQGIIIHFPSLELPSKTVSPSERELEVLRLLARLDGDGRDSLGSEITRNIHNLLPNSTVYVAVSVADPELPGAIEQLRRKGHSVMALIYDAQQFSERKRPFAGKSAADPGFLGELRSAGAVIQAMPLDGLGK